MRCIGLAVTVGTLILVAASGCGYLPSELTKEKTAEEKKEKTRNSEKPNAPTSSTPAQNSSREQINDLYVYTGGFHQPFRE